MGKTPVRYTVVQHSGYGYAGKPAMYRGLEVRAVSTKAEQTAVERAGGVLFDTHREADDSAEKWMFPEGTDSGAFLDIVPRAAGGFSTVKVDDLAVYVPVREIVG